MTLDELQQTHAFQARRDLILRPLPHLSPAEIVRGVRDEAFVAEHATGEPFYRGISYMLVSMECLIGAAYTRLAAAAGLTGGVRRGDHVLQVRQGRTGRSSAMVPQDCQRTGDRSHDQIYSCTCLNPIRSDSRAEW
jgi:hypothetical protein